MTTEELACLHGLAGDDSERQRQRDGKAWRQIEAVPGAQRTAPDRVRATGPLRAAGEALDVDTRRDPLDRHGPLTGPGSNMRKRCVRQRRDRISFGEERALAPLGEPIQ